MVVVEKGLQAVLDGLARIAGDPALGARLGEAGRAHVLERHTWSRSASALLDELKGIVHGQHGNAVARAAAS